jgi:predicted NBD/HSP70 family sugar kinase
VSVSELGSFDRIEYDPGIYAHPRLTNRQVLVGLIRVSAGITRSELASATGISKSTTAQLVAEMLEGGLVAEITEISGGARGPRKSTTLRPILPHVIVAGIHIKHGSIIVGVADMNGDTLDSTVVPVDLHSSPVIALELAARELTALLAARQPGDPELGAVVAALPGPIDRATGAVCSPSVLSAWSGVNPAEHLSDLLGLPVHVDNDANLGAWGELEKGAAADFPHAVYLEASEGIGAGIILNGRVYTGGAGIAGEIGHVQVDPAGPLCRCGQNGCVEVVVSSGPILDRLQQVHGQDSRRTIASYTDEVSARILREAGHTLGKVVAETCNVLNPQAVIVGGALGEAHPSYLEGMREAVRRYAQPVIARDLVVLPGSLGEMATLVGCFVRGTHSVFARESRLESEGRTLPRQAGAGLVCSRQAVPVRR